MLTCGAFTPEGDFLELPQLDLERLGVAWQEAVFALYLAPLNLGPLEPGPRTRSNRRSSRTCALGNTVALPLELAVPPCRLRPVSGNQISYQSSVNFSSDGSHLHGKVNVSVDRVAGQDYVEGWTDPKTLPLGAT